LAFGGGSNRHLTPAAPSPSATSTAALAAVIDAVTPGRAATIVALGDHILMLGSSK
jgi:hypothetical protein